MAVQSWEVISALAKCGMGYGLVPDFLLDKETELKTVECKGFSHTYEIYAFYRKEMRVSKSIQLLISALVHR